MITFRNSANKFYKIVFPKWRLVLKIPGEGVRHLIKLILSSSTVFVSGAPSRC